METYYCMCPVAYSNNNNKGVDISRVRKREEQTAVLSTFVSILKVIFLSLFEGNSEVMKSKRTMASFCSGHVETLGRVYLGFLRQGIHRDIVTGI